MDDGGRAVEGSSATDAACASAAASSGLHWRADPDRRIATLVVRGARTAMHVAGLYRRRDEPVDASAVCGDGVDVDYFEATRAYLDRYGKPIAFYSDKHAVFRVNKKDAAGGDGMTQFGRALHALNIDIICANSSQAKGRVERANGTLQDRLVKEMRLRSIDTVAAGNAFLPIFMADYNTRFAKAPFDERDLHRPLVGDDDLDDAFAWKEDRAVSKNLTLQYDKVLFILEPNEITRSLACKRVMILDYPDGRFAIRHNGVDLPYRTFDKRPQVNQAAIVENKRLGPVLAYIAEKQKEVDMSRSAKAPRRRGQRNHMFKVG